MATGDRTYSGNGKVSVTFGWELLDSINAMAAKEGITFAEAVRRICGDHFEARPNDR